MQHKKNSNVFDETINYYNQLKNHKDIISNFVQCDLWKKKVEFVKKKYNIPDDDIIFPMILFEDEFESSNALGSHKGINKCAAIYLSLPLLPPELRSKLENIFLFALYNSLDGKSVYNKLLYAKLIEELEFLQRDGIVVSYPDGEKK